MIVYRNVNYSKAETQEKGRIKYLIDNNEYYVEEAARSSAKLSVKTFLKIT